jgi:hypothetical protein
MFAGESRYAGQKNPGSTKTAYTEMISTAILRTLGLNISGRQKVELKGQGAVAPA